MLIEYEDMFPFTGPIAGIAARNAYAESDVRELLHAIAGMPEFSMNSRIRVFRFFFYFSDGTVGGAINSNIRSSGIRVETKRF